MAGSRKKTAQAELAAAKLLRAAEVAWAGQQYAESIALLERAARDQPSNPALRLNLARAHGLRFDYPAAERCFERAVEVSQQRAQTLGEAALVCLELERVDLAICYLERASEKNGVSIDSLMTLADILVRDSRFEDAAALVARAERIERDHPRVRMQQAALLRSREELEGAESVLRSLLGDAAAGAPVRIRAAYALAEIFDRTDRCAAAVGMLLEAKALQRASVAPHAAALQLMQERGREMEQTISAAVLARWREAAPELAPARRIALLCGHPRSGTTLLEQVLDSHSGVVSAEETRMMHDEAYLPLIRDFPEGTSILGALDAVPTSLLRHARANYFDCTERFLGAPLEGRLLIDKNPALNLMIPMVVRVFPESKFLVALRDPRDVILSCFFQSLPLTPISSAYLSLDGAVNQYASAMGFWLDMVPRMGDGWMYVRYEAIVDDLARVARSVLDFLGLDFEERVLRYHDHARGKRVRSPSYADVTKPVYRSAVGRWKRYEEHLEPYLVRLARFLDAFGYR